MLSIQFGPVDCCCVCEKYEIALNYFHNSKYIVVQAKFIAQNRCCYTERVAAFGGTLAWIDVSVLVLTGWLG